MIKNQGNIVLEGDFLNEFSMITQDDGLFKDGENYLDIYGERFVRARHMLNLPQDKTILDIGSYPGMAINYFSENRYMAYGFFPETYKNVLTKYGIEYLEASIEEDNSGISWDDVDIVLFQEIFEHLRRPVLALRNMYKKMRKESILYLTTNNAYYYGYIVKSLLGKSILDPIETEDSLYPGHMRYYDINELSHSLESVGFHVISKANINFLPRSYYYRNQRLGWIKNALSIILSRSYSTHIELIAKK